MAKSLAQIATRIKDLASAKAPVRTGKLSRAVKDYNRPSGMIKETSTTSGKKSIEFQLDYAPPGAEYGKWWNDPTVSKTVKKGKTKNVPIGINFAQKAVDSPEIEQMINDYLNSAADDILIVLSKEIDKL
jgi:hypothetical protein